MKRGKYFRLSSAKFPTIKKSKHYFCEILIEFCISNAMFCRYFVDVPINLGIFILILSYIFVLKKKILYFWILLVDYFVICLIIYVIWYVYSWYAKCIRTIYKTDYFMGVILVYFLDFQL